MLISPTMPDKSKGRSMIEPRPNNHQGTLGVNRLARLVTDRDLAVLGSVEAHRLITTRQIYDLHFWNHASYASGIRACTRVLARLEQHRLIRRLDRPVGGVGGGSASTIWALDVAGDRLLRRGTDRRRRHTFEPSVTFTQHTLAVTEVRVRIEQAARLGIFDLLSAVTEPANWRTFPGELGATLQLKPDLEVVTADGEYEDHWFLEVDLGTESGTALLRKCHAYDRYRRSGREQAAAGVFPRVLWLMPDERRAALLRRLIEDDRDLEPRLFAVTTTDRLLEALTGIDAAWGGEASVPPMTTNPRASAPEKGAAYD